MIHVTVSYQVKPEFVSENKANIHKFLKDFKTLDTSKFEYRVFLKENGKTFVHTSSYVDGSVQNKILNVPSFLEFQRRRDESGLNNSHQVEILERIGGTNQSL